KIVWFSSKNPVKHGTYVDQGKMVYAYENEVKKICAIEEIFLPGEHNIENALAAAAIAMLLAIPIPVIRHTLRTFKGVEHRIEIVKTDKGITYINDSKGTNVDSTLKAIAAMKEPTAIILGGYDKQVDFSLLAKAIKDHENMVGVVLIGETAKKIEKALTKVQFTNLQHGASLKEAVRKASEMVNKGGTVLLSPACASFGMFENYEQRGIAFKNIVEELS
ncbi:MAG: UDP-N-acetylmuramoyl-L-alanine--D-glutamate ligase, partial [Clostridiales bacterium]|nr:UDP-N-acetylmuramoyl-L-alanine--D-glutamate ligase [Clostridiales bacterium]